MPPAMLAVRQPVAEGYTAALAAARESVEGSASSSDVTASSGIAASSTGVGHEFGTSASLSGGAAPNLSPVSAVPKSPVGLVLRATPPPPRLPPRIDEGGLEIFD